MSLLLPSKGGQISDVLREFNSHYRDAVQQEHLDRTKREDTLRVSGFPYCGLRHLFLKLTANPRMINFGGAYYTGAGTVTHDALQHWLGYTGRMYGAWVCQEPGCKGHREFSNKNTCPSCGGIMRYKELEVKAFDHISGHLDGIYRTKDGELFVVDYKTSSIRIITTNSKTHMLPYAYNVAQITAYVALGEWLFDVEIRGWILHYLARDNPLTVSVSTGDIVTNKAKGEYLLEMKRWSRHYEHVMVHLERLADAKMLIDEKPCKNCAMYEERYATFEGCPLAKNGACFNPHDVRDVLKQAWVARDPEWQSKNMPKYLKRMFFAP